MMKTHLIVAVLAVFLASTLSSAQTPDSCEGNGRYCFGEELYECVNGEPEFIQYCLDACEGGECVTVALEPGVGYAEPEGEPEPASNYIIWIVLSLVIIAILYFFVRIMRQK